MRQRVPTARRGRTFSLRPCCPRRLSARAPPALRRAHRPSAKPLLPPQAASAHPSETCRRDRPQCPALLHPVACAVARVPPGRQEPPCAQCQRRRKKRAPISRVRRLGPQAPPAPPALQNPPSSASRVRCQRQHRCLAGRNERKFALPLTPHASSSIRTEHIICRILTDGV